MIDDKLFKYVKNIMPLAQFPAPFVKQFNMEFIEFYEGNTQARVTIDKMWTNPFGIAHGGFLFTILDEILGTACCSMLSKKIYNDIIALSTTNHDIFYHSPAKIGDTLIVKGNVLSARKNMIFVKGHIEQEINATLVAESKGIWFVKR